MTKISRLTKMVENIASSIITPAALVAVAFGVDAARENYPKSKNMPGLQPARIVYDSDNDNQPDSTLEGWLGPCYFPVIYSRTATQEEVNWYKLQDSLIKEGDKE